jgi:hypothetical protein
VLSFWSEITPRFLKVFGNSIHKKIYLIQPIENMQRQARRNISRIPIQQQGPQYVSPPVLNPQVERILLQGRDQMEMNPFSQKVWDMLANEFQRLRLIPQNVRSQTVARHLFDVPVDMSPSTSTRKKIVSPKVSPQRKSSIVTPTVNTVPIEKVIAVTKPVDAKPEKPKIVTSESDLLKKRVDVLTKEVETKDKQLKTTQEQWFQQFKEMEKRKSILKGPAEKPTMKSDDQHVQEDQIQQLTKQIVLLENELKNKAKEDNQRKQSVEIMIKEKEKIITSSTDIIKAIQLLSKLEKDFEEMRGAYKDKHDEKLIFVWLKTYISRQLTCGERKMLSCAEGRTI